MAVETAILVPPVIALLALVAVAGRTGLTKVDLDAAAQGAARQISIERTPSDAVDDAEAVARRTLQVGSPTCRSMTFNPAITATEVTVEITCAVDLSAATMLPVPGTVTLNSSATEVIDRFRENSP